MKEKDLNNRLNSNVNKTERKYSFKKGKKVSIPVNIKTTKKDCKNEYNKKECTCTLVPDNDKKTRTFDDLINKKTKKLCSLDGDKIYEINNKTSEAILNDEISKFINNNKATFNDIPKIIKRCSEIHDDKKTTNCKDNGHAFLNYYELGYFDIYSYQKKPIGKFYFNDDDNLTITSKLYPLNFFAFLQNLTMNVKHIYLTQE